MHEGRDKFIRFIDLKIPAVFSFGYF